MWSTLTSMWGISTALEASDRKCTHPHPELSTLTLTLNGVRSKRLQVCVRTLTLTLLLTLPLALTPNYVLSGTDVTLSPTSQP